MRADRLLAILLLLQNRGRMTAQALAEELDVSIRTMYRDLDALSIAGAPIYADRGPGGGWNLLKDYQAAFSWFTEAELRLLFTAAKESPINELAEKDARQALWLKLFSILPTAQRRYTEEARQRLYLDTEKWWNQRESVPFLHILHDAVWAQQKVHIVYRRSDGTTTTRLIEPLGLVSKGYIWYVVGNSEDISRVYRISRIQSCVLTEVRFERPEKFDLSLFWKEWQNDFWQTFSPITVTIRTTLAETNTLAKVLGEEVYRLVDQPDTVREGDNIELQLQFESLDAAQRALLGLGTAVEVLFPTELRNQLQKIAASVTSLYSKERTINATSLTARKRSPRPAHPAHSDLAKDW